MQLLTEKERVREQLNLHRMLIEFAFAACVPVRVIGRLSNFPIGVKLRLAGD